MPLREANVNRLLLAAIVVAWSTSWIALKAQTGQVAAEVSVFWRFLLAAPLVFLWARFRGHSLALPGRAHVLMAAMGVLIFSSNFILYYRGALHLPSGLLSVVFALASPLNLILGALIFREPIRARVALGGLAGVAGVALLFLPEFATANGAGAAKGLALCLVGTLCFCLGNMASTRLQRDRVAVVPATAWGMTYGAVWSGLLALATGARFAIELTLPYLGGLAWLVVVSTVVAFLTYLTLLGRIGAARAGYATVLFPVFALLISAALEGYRFGPAALAGVALVAFGNWLVLRREG